MKFGVAGIGTSNIRLEEQKNNFPLTVRVKDIILDQNHPKFEEYYEWNGIGTIFFDDIKIAGASNLSAQIPSAKPYFSNIKFYPLKGEIVSVILSINPEKGLDDKFIYSLYYLPPSNIWNSPHHNVSKDETSLSSITKGKNYQEVSGGMINRDQKNSNLFLFGDTFKEKSNILPLYFYEGDHILEGRWGNSIRLGSTVKKPSFPNEWSNSNEEGDPITIITNTILGEKSNFSPRLENVNEDFSSIYLTSTQKIPFIPSSFETNSFGPKDNSPSHPREYQKSQIILNSGRLILNSKEGGVLISSPNIIHLSAGDSIHFDSNDKIVLSSGELYLIDRNASEQAVLGNQLVSLIETLIQTLKGIETAFRGAANGGGGVPTLNNYSQNINTSVSRMETQLSKILSNKVKLK